MTDIAFDMAREMARHVDAGSSSDEIDAAMLKAFPTATTADMQRALQIGLDQMKWEDEREEAVRKVADLLFNGGTDAEIKAAIERTKLSAETTLLRQSDKTES